MISNKNLNKTFTVTSSEFFKKGLASVPEEEYDSEVSDAQEYEDADLNQFKFDINMHKTMHQPLSGKLAANQAGSEIRRSKPLHRSAGSENEFGLKGPEMKLSPMKAHIKNKWGKSSRNWSLWSVWDSPSLQFSYLGSKTATSKLSYEFERGQFINDINFAFKKHRLNEKGWEDIQQNILVLQVTKQNFGERYFPFTQEITLDAKQMIFEEDKHGQPTAYYLKSIPVKLLACAGLAEILESIMQESDVLVISGGYDALRDQENPGTSLIGLNFNKEQHTQILRLPENQYQLILYEKIEPRDEDKRFKFTYRVQCGRFQREVEQHRTFNRENFCRKVTDTLAYSRVRWDFPVPIVRGASVQSLYEMFCSPNFKMPPLRPPSSSDDDSFYTPPSKKRDTLQQHSPFRTSRVYSYGGGSPFRQSRKLREVERSSKPYSCASVLCLATLAVLMIIMGGILMLVWNSDMCHVPTSVSRTGSAYNDNSPSNYVGGIGSLLLGYQKEDSAPSEVVDDTSNLKILEKIWQRRERYYYINDLNSNGIYRWVTVKTRIVVQWIDVAIRWIGKNCNLQCLLAKLGFNADEILDLTV